MLGSPKILHASSWLSERKGLSQLATGKDAFNSKAVHNTAHLCNYPQSASGLPEKDGQAG